MPAKSILVVEDDLDIRETLSELLSAEGYAVGACANGLEALTRLRTGGRTDVILLDLMMPVMDGWQFRVHQKRDPELASIPVVALSADGTSKAEAIDADAYLRKPVDHETLLAAVERAFLGVERRRVQLALAETERLASLGTLSAGLAHEINNPLAYVTSNVAFATRAIGKDDASPEDLARARAALADATEGCQRIRAIVRDLQIFSRAPDDDRPPVDVRPVLDSAASMVMHEISSRARLEKEYGDVPAVMASAGRLGQVFANLILNAAQAIPLGDPERNEVRLVVRSDADSVIVEVRDTGDGIPDEIRARIFDPFFTTKPVGVGTGLGLSIAHNIVRSSGGELTVESVVGKGTVFRVRLPASSEPVVAKRGTPPPGELAARRARVLVIDDDPFIITMLKRVLREWHDLETTSRPNDAIARIQAGERFDVILCDMKMPGKDGIGVRAAIVEIAPDQAERMLFLTGGSTNVRAQEFLARHPGAVVEKPFVTTHLLAQIDATIAAVEAKR